MLIITNHPVLTSNHSCGILSDEPTTIQATASRSVVDASSSPAHGHGAGIPLSSMSLSDVRIHSSIRDHLTKSRIQCQASHQVDRPAASAGFLGRHPCAAFAAFRVAKKSTLGTTTVPPANRRNRIRDGVAPLLLEVSVARAGRGLVHGVHSLATSAVEVPFGVPCCWGVRTLKTGQRCLHRLHHLDPCHVSADSSAAAVGIVLEQRHER
ncbi:hypothetical protein G7046_g8774 [Stylonectria norvegica]|nr:hypothetical protein G7046_g8774 [Stylonectria norvegica]